MRIEKIKPDKDQQLEKITITKPAVVFVASSKNFPAHVRVFEGV